MEDIIDIIVTETTNLIEITSQPTDEIIDVNIIDNREDVTLNVTPTLVEININSLTGNFGILWGEIEGTLSNQTDLQNALNLKADLVDGKVPSSQLPSYVDDVVEVANYAALPVTGEVGKIYITLDTNYIYRWTGSTYVEIKDSSAVWGAITGTLSNQTDLQNALNAKDAVLTFNSPLSRSTNTVSIPAATATINGYLSSADWTTFNAKQAALSGTGFVKISGTTISYDNSTYLTTSAAASTYLALAGGTMTGALFGASASFSGYVGFNGNTSPLYPVDVAGSGRFSGDLRIESTNPRIYLTDTDNNPDYFISNTDGTFTVYDVTNSTARFTIGTTGNATFTNAITGGGSITGQSLYSNGIISAGSSVTATRLILSGGTGNTGLYFGHTDRVVLANYGVGGIDFEVNSGTIVATLFPSGNFGLGIALDAGYKLDVNGTARISGALSGTSATFTSNVTIRPSAGYNAYFQTSGTSVRINYLNDALSANVGAAFRATDYSFQDSTGSPVFTIASTGAATFSSSVTSVTSGANSGFNTGALIAKSNGNNFRYTQIGYDNTSNYGWIQALEQGTAYTNLILNGAGGNVGIGTTSPYNPGGNAQTSLEMSGTSYSTIYLSANSATVRGQFTADNLNSWVEMGARTNHPLLFLTNNTERMRITSVGHIQTNGNPVYAYSGSISIGGTYQTIFAAVSGGVYLVSVTTDSADGTFGLLTVINDPDKSLGMIYGNNISLQFSGDNVQMKSTNGSTYNTTWTATRLK